MRCRVLPAFQAGATRPAPSNSGQEFQQRLGPRLGRGRVLAGDEPPVGDDEGDPVRRLLVEPAEALQLVLHEERHDLGEVDRFLLAVGEARHPLALHDRLALELDAMEHAGRVADRGDRLAGVVEGLDEGDRMRVLGQVPHRAVAAGIEDRVVIRGLDVGEPHGVRQHRLGRGILLETPRQFGLALGRVADRVEGRLPALGRGDGHGRPGVEKGEVGRGELLEPEAGLAARVAELVVGGQDHEDLHEDVLRGQSLRDRLGTATTATGRYTHRFRDRIRYGRSSPCSGFAR